MSAARRSKKSRLMGNHQRAWIWGRHAVLEAVRSERWQPVEVVAAEEVDDGVREELERWISRANDESATGEKPILRQESGSRLSELCHHDEHQGLIARMPAYPYLSGQDFVDNLSERSLILILDRLQDAFNFGACLRCADVFGVDGVLMGSHAQAEVTSQVVRSSAGAVHHVPIARSDDLTQTLKELKAAGLQLVGATEKADRTLADAKLTGAVGMMVGNEGEGIAAERLELCDESVSIPQLGTVQSLNVAVATGILLYEAVRQRTHPSEDAASKGSV